MNRLTLTLRTAISLCFLLIAAPAQGSIATTQMHAHFSDEPINTMCPIGKEGIVDGVPTLEYKGNTLGFCCPGCSIEFMDWNESDRDLFVANAKIGKYEGDNEQAKQVLPVMKTPSGTILYPFNTCPISGGELGSMGDAIVKTYAGREVKFCCQMCIPKFEKNLKASFKEMDRRIIDTQLPFYPATACLVSDESFVGDDADEPINYVYQNRLIQLCCKMCISTFKKDPASYIAKLDQAVIAQQSDKYPLTACPVSGEPLGSMGDPIHVVHQGRLVKFCCSMCISQFEADPMPTILKIDAAWKTMHDD